MNLTPIDIQQTGFKVRVRGYDRKEVDSFLDLITDDFENLIRENTLMKDKITDLEKQVADFKKRESSLNNTLIRAEEMVGQLQQSAQKEAKLITKEAEIQAEEIVKMARIQVADIQREIMDLKKEKVVFVEKLRSVVGTFKKVIELETEQDRSALENSGPVERQQESAGDKRETAIRVVRPKP